MRGVFIDILGLSEYKRVWELQKRFRDVVERGLWDNVLIFTEHEHVYTIGKAGDEQDVKNKGELLKHLGVKIYKVDRGGKITYHGPGQIVGYPIFHLGRMNLDVHTYLRNLEEVVILTLSDFGINGQRKSGLTGIWVDDEKIASIGINVSRWITIHGFALNVNTDLRYFDLIFPCGLRNINVTSMKRLLGQELDMAKVKENLKEKFEYVFSLKFDRSITWKVFEKSEKFLKYKKTK